MALNTMNAMYVDKIKRCDATRGVRGSLTRGITPSATLYRRLKPTATIETLRCEAQDAAERQIMVARPFKVGEEGVGVDVATGDSCREEDAPATTTTCRRLMRRGLKPSATIGTSRSEVENVVNATGNVIAAIRRGLKPTATVGTSRSEAQDAAEQQLMVARPFKAGKENPHPPSSRSDERYARTIARNVAEVLEA
jgi:hypothetical protein